MKQAGSGGSAGANSNYKEGVGVLGGAAGGTSAATGVVAPSKDAPNSAVPAGAGRQTIADAAKLKGLYYADRARQPIFQPALGP